MPNSPEVSVLLPVFNCERYIGEAIKSILDQTFQAFELLVIDDESTDRTGELVQTVADDRIKYLKVPHGGLVPALNFGLAASSGSFIARMDADDRALPERLDVQLRYLKKHTFVDIVSSDVHIINAAGVRTGTQKQRNVTNESLRAALLYQKRAKPIIHPSVMMRREVLDHLKGYREFTFAEDHDLWLRAIDRFEIRRINQFLLEYRIHEGGVSRTRVVEQCTASAMSAVCYLIEKHSGQDIFRDYRPEFDDLSSMLSQHLRQRYVPQTEAFRDTKSALRGGNPLAGFFAFTRLFARYGFTAMPGNTTKTVGKLVASLASHYLDGMIKRDAD